jgi:hypothetical protein
MQDDLKMTQPWFPYKAAATVAKTITIDVNFGPDATGKWAVSNA